MHITGQKSIIPSYGTGSICGQEPRLYKGSTVVQVFRPRGKLTKLRKNDMLLIVDTKNAEFRGHKNIRQKVRKKLLKSSQQFCRNQFQLGKR